MKRAVFLDRDGVINRAFVRGGKSFPPSSIMELEILPGVDISIKQLKEAGYLLIVVTNQPDVATGITSKSAVMEINHYLQNALRVDEIRVCYHRDEDRCFCRKPLPGMLLDASSQHNINLQKSFMVGDRWKDIEAGRAAGCKTFYINYGYQEKQPDCPDFIVSSLPQAAQIILGEYY